MYKIRLSYKQWNYAETVDEYGEKVDEQRMLKIGFIRLFRDAFQLSLKEAKELVDTRPKLGGAYGWGTVSMIVDDAGLGRTLAMIYRDNSKQFYFAEPRDIAYADESIFLVGKLPKPAGPDDLVWEVLDIEPLKDRYGDMVIQPDLTLD